MTPTRVTVVGEPGPSGAYLLRIRLQITCDVVFGRFHGGRAVPLLAGDYLYVGSAMGRAGSATLANRLLRHARRSGVQLPHPIYHELVSRFFALGWLPDRQITLRPKSLRWHIDYLLDYAEAELAQVYLFCSPTRQEEALAQSLMADPATSIPMPGLGASDDRGRTHLLCATGDEEWWHSLSTLAHDGEIATIKQADGEGG
jgi:Uri superfamily endonuclease